MNTYTTAMEEKLIWQTRNEMDAPTNPLQSMRESYCMSAKDMGEEKFDAWMYGIIVGWDDESYLELAKTHNWSKKTVEYNKLLHENYCKA